MVYDVSDEVTTQQQSQSCSWWSDFAITNTTVIVVVFDAQQKSRGLWIEDAITQSLSSSITSSISFALLLLFYNQVPSWCWHWIDRAVEIVCTKTCFSKASFNSCPQCPAKPCKASIRSAHAWYEARPRLYQLITILLLICTAVIKFNIVQKLWKFANLQGFLKLLKIFSKVFHTDTVEMT